MTITPSSSSHNLSHPSLALTMAIQSRRQRLLWLYVNSILLSSLLFSSAVVAAFQFQPQSGRRSGFAGRVRRQIHVGIGIGGSISITTDKDHGNALERPDEDESSATNNHNDIDSLARRRLLLLSLLASSSSTTIPFFPARASAIGSTSSSSSPATSTKENDVVTPPQRIIRPPLDERSYLTYTLPSNDLRILLCSDPSTTSAAASISVHVGACSDPIDIPGLAHFCEHMLFLGTELYPGEDSFSKFLSSNGEIYII
jgi:hypothetical protein